MSHNNKIRIKIRNVKIMMMIILIIVSYSFTSLIFSNAISIKILRVVNMKIMIKIMIKSTTI